MKFIIKFILFIFYINICAGQNLPLDFNAIENWPRITYMQISNNGKFVSYIVIRNEVLNLVISSTENYFKKDFSSTDSYLKNGKFSEDSRYFIFRKAKDTICILDLEDNKEIYLPQVMSFKISNNDNINWLAYQKADNTLLLTNLNTGKKQQFLNVADYVFNKKGNTLLLKMEPNISQSNTCELQWIDLSTNKVFKIWHGENPFSFVFDQSGLQVAFIAGSEKSEKTIWRYQKGMDSADLWVDSGIIEFSNRFEIRNDRLSFSPLGDKLFFNLYKKKTFDKLKPNGAMVDIWSYNDRFLQPAQLDNIESDDSRPFQTVIHKNSKKIIRLEDEEDEMSSGLNLNEGGNDNFILLENKVNSWESYRMPNERTNTYLVNTNDGSRKCIIEKLSFSLASFSPKGKYVYWYNPEKKAYFTYNIESGVTTNITDRMPSHIYDEAWDLATEPPTYGSGGWLANDEAILIYDRYDIWQIDPQGVKPPLNITNGYGRKNKTILRCINIENEQTSINKRTANILCGFNEENKQNGFFKVRLDSLGCDPELLIMSPHVYYFSSKFKTVELSDFLKKAKYTDTYLLTRMNSFEFPNLYTTKDFKEFQPVSDLAPQKKYNWLKSELVTWKTLDDRNAQGVLYKPQDFDPQKKYPIIFKLYETFSPGVNQFINPELSVGPMNIPFFVSQGYVVFCPDIHYIIGEPGQSAYNYVISAANMFKKKTWVDKIGLQGHSFGGWEVNYLITRTHLFAAAASAAGMSDLTSTASSLLQTLVGFTQVERGQPRMGVTLWQDSKRYIKNSPLYSADKIVTPLLIMHNKNDYGVVWSQGVGFFTALRRLNKVVWLLQYDNGGHVLHSYEDKCDYTTRLLQYFNHYLKGTPMPKWMLSGVPATEKGIVTGLELDTAH
jgi:hypothetical protein